MRHRLKGRKLGRNGSHRNALYANMIRCILVTSSGGGAKVEGRIRTTLAKAKELRPMLEKLITIGVKAHAASVVAAKLASGFEKSDERYLEWRRSEAGRLWLSAQAKYMHFQRNLFAVLRSRELVDLMIRVVAVKCVGRDGGYTRVVKLAKSRLADGARMAYLELVDEVATLPVV